MRLKKRVKENGGNCVSRRFITFIFQLILLGQLNEGELDVAAIDQ
jgi:hypothetical protein